MNSWVRLFRSLILRPLREDLLRTALTIFAVALGVGVVIAIDLAGDAATGSFQSSLETVVGKTDFEITANGGIDERILAALVALPINARFCPEAEAHTKGIGLIYGVDVLCGAWMQGDGMQGGGSGKMGLFVSAALARRLHLSDGAPVRVEGHPLKVVVFNAKDAEIAALDIADFQDAFGTFGRLDGINVFVENGQDFEEAERQIRSVLPTGYELRKPGTRSDENRRMLRAFRWNLRFLSYVSLVVGAFLIYNTISISVVRRRAEVGILRALGTSRAAIFSLFLGEAVWLGLAGALVGIAVGRGMAQAAVGLISQTISALYTSSQPGAISLGWMTVVEAVGAGTLVAVFSAAAPAREAMRVTPAEAMSRGSREHEVRLHVRRDAWLAAALAVLAMIASLGPTVDGKSVWGYVATLLSIGVAALFSPALVLGTVWALRGLARRLFGAEGLLAGRSLTASLGRTSIVVAALGTAVAMMISVAIMVGSFRETVVLWMDTQLRADIYIGRLAPGGAGIFPPIPPEVLSIVKQIPGAGDTDVLYEMEFRFDQDRLTMGAVDMGVLLRHGHLRFLSAEGGREGAMASLMGRDRVIISEPMANKHGLRTGDAITLDLGTHRIPFRIAGVYYDYSSDRGFVMMDSGTMLKYVPHQPPVSMGVYAKPGGDRPELLRRVRNALAAYPVVVSPNETMRRNAIEVFDRTFRITWALEGVAIAVAMLGAANSLLALVLDRRRDLGLLQYLGAAGGQIRRMILVEAGFLGLLASSLGLGLGSALSLLLVYVINKQSFGWTIQFHPPFALLGGAILLVWSVTVLAGLYPARVASRLNPIETIHEE